MRMPQHAASTMPAPGKHLRGVAALRLQRWLAGRELDRNERVQDRRYDCRERAGAQADFVGRDGRGYARMMILWLLVLALAAWVLARVFWGYPPPPYPTRSLGRREVAFLEAAATATFPPGGAISASGADAGVGAYTDRWMATLHPRMRLLMRLLFFLVEHATLFFPAPGWQGFRRFTTLLPGQQSAVLDGWATSRSRARRLVFQSMRAIVTMGYFAHPPVLRQLGLEPRAIESPVCEADLLFPAIGKSPDSIAHTRVGPPSDGTPIDLSGPVDPRYAEEQA